MLNAHEIFCLLRHKNLVEYLNICSTEEGFSDMKKDIGIMSSQPASTFFCSEAKTEDEPVVNFAEEEDITLESQQRSLFLLVKKLCGKLRHCNYMCDCPFWWQGRHTNAAQEQITLERTHL